MPGPHPAAGVPASPARPPAAITHLEVREHARVLLWCGEAHGARHSVAPEVDVQALEARRGEEDALPLVPQQPRRGRAHRLGLLQHARRELLVARGAGHGGLRQRIRGKGRVSQGAPTLE